MRNICLILEYVGTNYCGFQRQKNGLTIQEVLENSIFEVTGETCKTYPSGRTDAGVHALGQVVNFFTSSLIPSQKFKIVLNKKLPKDIRVIESFEKDKNFNSRKSAKKKTYIYKICCGEELSAFESDRFLLVSKNIDIQKMNLACKKIEGKHDFSSFCSIKTTAKTKVRTIYDAHFEEDFVEDLQNKGSFENSKEKIIENKIDSYITSCSNKEKKSYITFHITGNGFLYNMVRIIVGTLLEIGEGKREIESLENLLLGDKRNMAGKTICPSGLYLKEVQY